MKAENGKPEIRSFIFLLFAFCFLLSRWPLPVSAFSFQISATQPCPRCGGRLTLRRCPTAHRRKFVCDCGYSAALPLPTRLRLAGYRELDLFDEEEFRADRS